MEMIARKKIGKNGEISIPSSFIRKMGKEDCNKVMFTIDNNILWAKLLKPDELIRIPAESEIRNIPESIFGKRIGIPRKYIKKLHAEDSKEAILRTADNVVISIELTEEAIDRIKAETQKEEIKPDVQESKTEYNETIDELDYEEDEEKESKYITPKQWFKLLKNNQTFKAKFNPYDYRWHPYPFEYIKPYFMVNVNGKVSLALSDDAVDNKTVIWRRLSLDEKDTLKKYLEYVDSFINYNNKWHKGKEFNVDNMYNKTDNDFKTFLDLIIQKRIITVSDDKRIKESYERYRDYISEHQQVSFDFDYKYMIR